MGFIDKMAFWKKKDDFGSDLGDDPFKDDSFGKDDPFAAPSNDTPAAKDPFGDDPFATPPPASTPAPTGSPTSDPFSQTPQESPHPQAFSQPLQTRPLSTPPPTQQGNSNSRDLDLVIAKLDTIKTMLDNVNRRLEMIEDLAKGEHPAQKTRYTW